MGLKKNNYMVKSLGVIIPTAYAQITELTVDNNNNANAIVQVQRNRDAIKEFDAYDIICYSCKVDKSIPVHEQVYNSLKENLFLGWEDDIVK